MWVGWNGELLGCFLDGLGFGVLGILFRKTGREKPLESINELVLFETKKKHVLLESFQNRPVTNIVLGSVTRIDAVLGIVVTNDTVFFGLFLNWTSLTNILSNRIFKRV